MIATQGSTPSGECDACLALVEADEQAGLDTIPEGTPLCPWPRVRAAVLLVNLAGHVAGLCRSHAVMAMGEASALALLHERGA